MHKPPLTDMQYMFFFSERAVNSVYTITSVHLYQAVGIIDGEHKHVLVPHVASERDSRVKSAAGADGSHSSMHATSTIDLLF
jgi:hypothetical protein